MVRHAIDFAAIDSKRHSVLDWLPDARALARSTAVVHERIGQLWYQVRGWE